MYVHERERMCVCGCVCVCVFMCEREYIYIDMVVSISGQTYNMRVNRRFHMYGTYIGFQAFQKKNASYAAVYTAVVHVDKPGGWLVLYALAHRPVCVCERERGCVCV